jgi:lysophospholipase L1-like esterase
MRRCLIAATVLLADLLGTVCVAASSDEIAQAPAERRIVVLGDSITKGVRTGVSSEEIFSARIEQTLLKEGLRVVVNNQGIGGERTDQALQRLAKDVLSQKPHVVLVMYGTNDSYVDIGRKESRLTSRQFADHLTEITRQLQEQDISVILMTEPRWGDKATRNGAGEHPNERLEEFLQQTRKVAEARKCPLVDHYTVWSQAREAGQDLSAWTTDECHPNAEGHERLAEAILPVLRIALKR